MAKQSLQTLKSWFIRGAKPTAQQFSDAFDSFVHKDDMIPQNKIEELSQTLTQVQQDVDAAFSDSIEEVNVNGTPLEKTDKSVNVVIPQADWNQNDATKLDYVKNRTHKKTDVELSILENQFIIGQRETSSVSLLRHIIAGKTYKVKIGNNEYTKEAIEYNGGAAINLDQEADIIVYTNASYVDKIANSGISQITINEIIVFEIEYTPLIDGYIPATVHRIDMDDNCKVLEFCKRLDLSVLGNKIRIKLPEGFVCCFMSGNGNVGFAANTFSANTTSWSTNAVIKATFVHAQTNSTASTENVTISKQSYTVLGYGFVPFIKDYVEIEVVTPCVGATPYATIEGKIYCRKED